MLYVKIVFYSYKGIQMTDKLTMKNCMERLMIKQDDIVDSFIISWCKRNQVKGLYLFDKGFKKKELVLLPIT